MQGKGITYIIKNKKLREKQIYIISLVYICIYLNGSPTYCLCLHDLICHIKLHH